jgi:hypothetical protein
MSTNKKKEIIESIEALHNLQNSEISLIENDAWESDIGEESLESIIKKHKIDYEELLSIVEEYRKDNKDSIAKSSNNNKKVANKKKKRKIGVGTIIIIGGVLLLAIAAYLLYLNRDSFISNTNNSTSYSKMQKKKDSNATTTHTLAVPKNNGNKQNNILDKSKKPLFETVSIDKVSKKDEAKNKIKKVLEAGATSKKITPVQCFTKTKYIGKEIVFYRKDGKNGRIKYTPAHPLDKWLNDGYLLESKIIGNDIDNLNKMVEVEKGKWIPVELFSKCTIISN